MHAPLPIRLVPDRLEAGVDEVGRGCLAGPVCAAAVILPPDFSLPLLNDSKQLSRAHREEYAEVIKEHAIAYAIGEASAEEIDKYNILAATFLAMERATEQLRPQPEYLLIDGNRFCPQSTTIPYETLIKGDSRVASIAAASVLAKVHRDRLMQEAADDYPQYGWDHNAGYGTKEHLAALHTYGVTPLHRRSFTPCRPTLFDLLP